MRLLVQAIGRRLTAVGESSCSGDVGCPKPLQKTIHDHDLSHAQLLLKTLRDV